MTNARPEAFTQFPKARRFHDYRKLLDVMHGQVDAVVVSIPDHMHAPVSLAAMELKQARLLREAAHLEHR